MWNLKKKSLVSGWRHQIQFSYNVSFIKMFCSFSQIFSFTHSQGKAPKVKWQTLPPQKHEIFKVYMTQHWFPDSHFAVSKWCIKSIYKCRWQSRKLQTRPMSARAPRLESAVCAPNENIRPGSDYSGSAGGQATWQSQHTARCVWSETLTDDWGCALTLCTSKQNYNVPTVKNCRRLRIE